MVENTERRLDRVFAAVADPTRRAILTRLRKAPATVGELARPFPVSLNAISKHVKVLEGAGLAHYRAFWTVRLDVLERHLLKRRRAH
jgi:DNA-binding transcriptional ArsR family regulator